MITGRTLHCDCLLSFCNTWCVHNFFETTLEPSVQEITVNDIPSTLAHFAMAHDAFNQHPTRKEIMYGLENGDVGQLFIDASSCHRGTTLANTDNRGAVTQLCSDFDLTQNGFNEVAVGRDDGSFEVYDMGHDGALQLVRPALQPTFDTGSRSFPFINHEHVCECGAALIVAEIYCRQFLAGDFDVAAMVAAGWSQCKIACTLAGLADKRAAEHQHGPQRLCHEHRARGVHSADVHRLHHFVDVWKALGWCARGAEGA